VLLSVWYVVLQRVLQLVVLRLRSHESKEFEIVVLHHEMTILRRRTRSTVDDDGGRVFLAATSRLLPRPRWNAFFVTPATLLDWSPRLQRPNRDRGGGTTASRSPKRHSEAVAPSKPLLDAR
jgi:putative transposase